MNATNGFSKYRTRLVTLILFSCFFYFEISAQELTPAEYFGDSYSEAITYCQNQKTNFETFFDSYSITTNEAIAVVFPEIIRYNRFRDFAETTALELAYIQGGKVFADFSIGRFQMKPSFVEMLEHKLLLYPDLQKQFNSVVTYSPKLTEQEIRGERIERLKQVKWQLQYLACFIRLAEKRFANELTEKHQERLLILSSAYNMGLNSNYEVLETLSKTKSFPYGKSRMGRFSYFDVANYFYTHDALQTQNSKP